MPSSVFRRAVEGPNGVYQVLREGLGMRLRKHYRNDGVLMTSVRKA